MGTFEIDLDRQTIIHSPRAAEIIGLDPSRQWFYESFTRVVHPEDLAIRNKAHEVARKTGNLFYECRILLPSGSVRWIRQNGTVLTQNETTFLVGTTLDITEEKEAASLLEKKIQERTMELNAANEQLKQFAYAASHDLQEPLRKISYFVDRLLSNNESLATEGNKQLTDRIQHTIVRMRRLIDDLLEYAHTSMRTPTYGDVDLNDTLREVIDDLEAKILESKAIVNLDVLPVVKGDPRQLRQLFHNLLSNALKYHKKDDPPFVQILSKKVTSNMVAGYEGACSDSKDFFEIEVKDNGIGFEQEDARRIFFLFQRLHGRAEYEGTGIGLAIVQRVIENHDGCIKAEGEPGQGASFKVLLPIKS
jgi:PAS domain S-box-containing protein